MNSATPAPPAASAGFEVTCMAAPELARRLGRRPRDGWAHPRQGRASLVPHRTVRIADVRQGTHGAEPRRVATPHGLSHYERDMLTEGLDRLSQKGPCLFASIEAGRSSTSELIVRKLTRRVRRDGPLPLQRRAAPLLSAERKGPAIAAVLAPLLLSRPPSQDR